MNKSIIDLWLKKMQKGSAVSKILPWQMEALDEGEFHTRFAVLNIPQDLTPIIPSTNTVLLKFLVNRQKGIIEFYLANQTPFHLIMRLPIKSTDKWEVLIGNLKQRLNRDFQTYRKGQSTIDNLYQTIKPMLKK